MANNLEGLQELSPEEKAKFSSFSRIPDKSDFEKIYEQANTPPPPEPTAGDKYRKFMSAIPGQMGVDAAKWIEGVTSPLSLLGLEVHAPDYKEGTGPIRRLVGDVSEFAGAAIPFAALDAILPEVGVPATIAKMGPLASRLFHGGANAAKVMAAYEALKDPNQDPTKSASITGSGINEWLTRGKNMVEGIPTGALFGMGGGAIEAGLAKSGLAPNLAKALAETERAGAVKERLGENGLSQMFNKDFIAKTAEETGLTPAEVIQGVKDTAGFYQKQAIPQLTDEMTGAMKGIQYVSQPALGAAMGFLSGEDLSVEDRLRNAALGGVTFLGGHAVTEGGRKMLGIRRGLKAKKAAAQEELNFNPNTDTLTSENGQITGKQSTVDILTGEGANASASQPATSAEPASDKLNLTKKEQKIAKQAAKEYLAKVKADPNLKTIADNFPDHIKALTDLAVRLKLGRMTAEEHALANKAIHDDMQAKVAAMLEAQSAPATAPETEAPVKPEVPIESAIPTGAGVEAAPIPAAVPETPAAPEQAIPVTPTSSAAPTVEAPKIEEPVPTATPTPTPTPTPEAPKAIAPEPSKPTAPAKEGVQWDYAYSEDPKLQDVQGNDKLATIIDDMLNEPDPQKYQDKEDEVSALLAMHGLDMEIDGDTVHLMVKNKKKFAKFDPGEGFTSLGNDIGRISETGDVEDIPKTVDELARRARERVEERGQVWTPTMEKTLRDKYTQLFEGDTLDLHAPYPSGPSRVASRNMAKLESALKGLSNKQSAEALRREADLMETNKEQSLKDLEALNEERTPLESGVTGYEVALRGKAMRQRASAEIDNEIARLRMRADELDRSLPSGAGIKNEPTVEEESPSSGAKLSDLPNAPRDRSGEYVPGIAEVRSTDEKTRASEGYKFEKAIDTEAPLSRGAADTLWVGPRNKGKGKTVQSYTDTLSREDAAYAMSVLDFLRVGGTAPLPENPTQKRIAEDVYQLHKMGKFTDVPKELRTFDKTRRMTGSEAIGRGEALESGTGYGEQSLSDLQALGEGRQEAELSNKEVEGIVATTHGLEPTRVTYDEEAAKARETVKELKKEFSKAEIKHLQKSLALDEEIQKLRRQAEGTSRTPEEKKAMLDAIEQAKSARGDAEAKLEAQRKSVKDAEAAVEEAYKKRPNVTEVDEASNTIREIAKKLRNGEAPSQEELSSLRGGNRDWVERTAGKKDFIDVGKAFFEDLFNRDIKKAFSGLADLVRGENKSDKRRGKMMKILMGEVAPEKLLPSEKTSLLYTRFSEKQISEMTPEMRNEKVAGIIHEAKSIIDDYMKPEATMEQREQILTKMLGKEAVEGIKAREGDEGIRKYSEAVKDLVDLGVGPSDFSEGASTRNAKTKEDWSKKAYTDADYATFRKNEVARKELQDQATEPGQPTKTRMERAIQIANLKIEDINQKAIHYGEPINTQLRLSEEKLAERGEFVKKYRHEGQILLDEFMKVSGLNRQESEAYLTKYMTEGRLEKLAPEALDNSIKKQSEARVGMRKLAEGIAAAQRKIDSDLKALSKDESILSESEYDSKKSEIDSRQAQLGDIKAQLKAAGYKGLGYDIGKSDEASHEYDDFKRFMDGKADPTQSVPADAEMEYDRVKRLQKKPWDKLTGEEQQTLNRYNDPEYSVGLKLQKLQQVDPETYNAVWGAINRALRGKGRLMFTEGIEATRGGLAYHGKKALGPGEAVLGESYFNHREMSALIRLVYNKPSEMMRTTYHEIGEVLRMVMTPEERFLMREMFNDGKRHWKENMSDAFADFSIDGKLNGKTINPESTLGQVFKKFSDFLTRVKNYLKGAGYNTVEDIFRKMERGELGDRMAKVVSPQGPELYDPTLETLNFEPVGYSIGSAIKKKIGSSLGRFDERDEVPLDTFLHTTGEKIWKDQKGYTNPSLGWYDKFFSTARKVAEKFPVFKPIYKTATRASSAAQNVMHHLALRYDPILRAKGDTLEKVSRYLTDPSTRFYIHPNHELRGKIDYMTPEAWDMVDKIHSANKESMEQVLRQTALSRLYSYTDAKWFNDYFENWLFGNRGDYKSFESYLQSLKSRGFTNDDITLVRKMDESRLVSGVLEKNHFRNEIVDAMESNAHNKDEHIANLKEEALAKAKSSGYDPDNPLIREFYDKYVFGQTELDPLVKSIADRMASNGASASDIKKVQDFLYKLNDSETVQRHTRNHLRDTITKNRKIAANLMYMPHVRGDGRFKVRLIRRDSEGNVETIWSKHTEYGVKRWERAQAENYRGYVEKLKARYESDPRSKQMGYTYEMPGIEEIPEPLEGLWGNINSVAMGKYAERVVDNLQSGKRLSEDEAQELHDTIAQTIRYDLMSRSTVNRNLIPREIFRDLNDKDSSIPGYDTHDVPKIFLNYIRRVSNYVQRSAFQSEAFHHLSKIDTTKDAGAFNFSANYIKDMMAPMSQLDKASGTARSAVFTYMLGGSIKSGVVQLTQQWATGVPMLARMIADHSYELKLHQLKQRDPNATLKHERGILTPKTYFGESKLGAEKVMATSLKDSLKYWQARNWLLKEAGKEGQWSKEQEAEAIRRSGLTKEEFSALSELVDSGHAEAQYWQEVSSTVLGGFSGAMGKLRDILIWPFSSAEKYNRLAAGLAGYRTSTKYLKQMGYSSKDVHRMALDRTEDFIDKTHYNMTKANLPAFARGGTTGATIGRTGYMFRAFPHNYGETIWESILDPKGEKPISTDVIARSLVYLSVMGGLAGLPFVEDGIDTYTKMTGDPIKAKMKGALGGDASPLQLGVMSGLPALLSMDLSQSLKIGMPQPSAHSLTETLLGVWGGMGAKFLDASTELSRGNVWRGIERASPAFVESGIKAVRMNQSGATTLSGANIYDKVTGEPLKLTAMEAGLQGIGFRQPRLASAQDARQTSQNMNEYYHGKRTDLAAEMRFAAASEDESRMEKALRHAQELSQQGAEYGIPPIKAKDIRAMLKPKKDKMSEEINRLTNPQ